MGNLLGVKFRDDFAWHHDQKQLAIASGLIENRASSSESDKQTSSSSSSSNIQSYFNRTHSIYFILNYLDDKELGPVASVCKLWNQAVIAVWQQRGTDWTLSQRRYQGQKLELRDDRYNRAVVKAEWKRDLLHLLNVYIVLSLLLGTLIALGTRYLTPTQGYGSSLVLSSIGPMVALLAASLYYPFRRQHTLPEVSVLLPCSAVAVAITVFCTGLAVTLVTASYESSRLYDNIITIDDFQADYGTALGMRFPYNTRVFTEFECSNGTLHIAPLAPDTYTTNNSFNFWAVCSEPCDNLATRPIIGKRLYDVGTLHSWGVISSNYIPAREAAQEAILAVMTNQSMSLLLKRFDYLIELTTEDELLSQGGAQDHTVVTGVVATLGFALLSSVYIGVLLKFRYRVDLPFYLPRHYQVARPGGWAL